MLPSRLSVRDQLRDGRASLRATKRKQVPAALGIALSVAAALTVLSSASSGKAEVEREFARLGANEVTARVDDSEKAAFESLSPAVVDENIAAIFGVLAGGTLAKGPTVAVMRVNAASAGATDVRQHVFEASSGVLPVVGIKAPELWRATPAQHIAIVGSALAKRLGLGNRQGETIFVEGAPFTVVGVLETSRRRPEILDGVIVPAGLLGSGPAGDSWSAEVLVETIPGFAESVGQSMRFAIGAGRSADVVLTVEPEPRRLAEAVSKRTRTLVLTVAGVSWLAGAAAIALTVGAGVNERRSELALRRVFGARPTHLYRLVLTEAVIVGALGGILGWALAWNAVMVIACIRGWDPVLDVALWISAPLLGAATGLLAGLPPARLASRIDPAEGLRHE